MKLQLALDVTSKKDALKLCRKAARHVDIIELGTPLIKAEGMGAIRDFKKFRKPIVADLKTMDTGFLEAGLAYENGADISTVCAAAGLPTVEGSIKAARKYRKNILVDFIGVKNPLRLAREVLKLKPDYLGVHTGIDCQKKGEMPFKMLKRFSRLADCGKLAVAGGISINTISEAVKFRPAIIIVGSAITKADNPAEAAKKIRGFL